MLPCKGYVYFALLERAHAARTRIYAKLVTGKGPPNLWQGPQAAPGAAFGHPCNNNLNTTVWTILLQINPTSTMSLIGTVLVEHSMLLLLKNLTIEGQLLPTYCSSDIDRRGHGCWVRVQYGIEVGITHV